MKKTIIFTLLGLVIGFAAGYVTNMAVSGYKIASCMFMLQEGEIVMMEKAAQKAYANQPTAVAIWALENYINTLKRVKEERAPAKNDKPYFLLRPDQSLTFAHARLGLIYKKMKNHAKSAHHFEQAMLHIKNTKLKAIKTEDDLIYLITRLDQKKK